MWRRVIIALSEQVDTTVIPIKSRIYGYCCCLMRWFTRGGRCWETRVVNRDVGGRYNYMYCHTSSD